jgi:hypothetical protein
MSAHIEGMRDKRKRRGVLRFNVRRSARRGYGRIFPFGTRTRRKTATICSRLHSMAPSRTARSRSKPVMS